MLHPFIGLVRAVGDRLLVRNTLMVHLYTLSLTILAFLDSFNWYTVPLCSWRAAVCMGLLMPAIAWLYWIGWLVYNHLELSSLDRFLAGAGIDLGATKSLVGAPGGGAMPGPGEVQFHRTRATAMVHAIGSAAMTATYALLLANIAYLYNDTTAHEGVQAALDHSFDSGNLSLAALEKREFLQDMRHAFVISTLCSSSCLIVRYLYPRPSGVGRRASKEGDSDRYTCLNF
jgi:hypothetical protein